MTTPLIILALIAVGVAIVVWFARKQPDAPRAGPQEGDTAWNDPVTPAEPASPVRPDASVGAPPTRDPQP